MTKYDCGPLHRYEVIWKSGHVEEVHCHQVMLPPIVSVFGTDAPTANRLTMHGQINERWMLVLDVGYDEILSVRRLGLIEQDVATTDQTL